MSAGRLAAVSDTDPLTGEPYTDYVIVRREFLAEHPDAACDFDQERHRRDGRGWWGTVPVHGRERRWHADGLAAILDILRRAVDQREADLEELDRLRIAWADLYEEFRIEGEWWRCRARSGDGRGFKAKSGEGLNRLIREHFEELEQP